MVNPTNDDTEYWDSVVSSCKPNGTGFVITNAEGWSLYIPELSGYEPKCGDPLRFYGRGIGYPVRGVVINEHVAYYRTAEDEAENRKLELQEREFQRRRQYETQGKIELAMQFARLPDCFRNRILKFRQANPDFGWQYESYEMFCCTEAVKIANGLRLAGTDYESFRLLDWKRQKEIVQDLDNGHSGNSFGIASLLAHYYLTNPEMVVMEHGALTPLVGCEDYGCPHPALPAAAVPPQ